MAERLENPNYIYSSGATQRFASEDSSSNRGEYTTGYNHQADVPAAGQEVTVVDPEHMTGSPGDGDEWAVGQDLYAYKQGVTGQTRGLDAGRHGMGMKNMTTENMADDRYEASLQDCLLVSC
jgi:hypothetical protein